MIKSYEGNKINLKILPSSEIKEVRQGQGQTVYTDGSKYQGNYNEDQMDGYGVFQWPDGTLFSGYFKKNLRNGSGTLELVSGYQIKGKWIDDCLEGYSNVIDLDGLAHEVKYSNNLIVRSKNPIKKYKDNDNCWLNCALVYTGIGFGMGYCFFDREYIQLGVIGGALWTIQFIESLCSSTFGYLNNVVHPYESVECLQNYVDEKPSIGLKIENFHYEYTCDQNDDKKNNLNKLKEEQKYYDDKRTELDYQINDAKLKNEGMIRILALQQEKTNLNQEEMLFYKKLEVNKILNQKSDENITKHKKKVITYSKTLDLKVKEYVDISDNLDFLKRFESGELIRIHVKTQIELSNSANISYQQIKDKLIIDNYTERYQYRKNIPLDEDFEVTEYKKLPSNVNYILVAENKPEWMKRRYFLLYSLFGFSSIIRKKLAYNTKVIEFNLVKKVTEIEK